MNQKISKYLIEEDRPLIVLPELAKEIGLEDAIVLQQLHWLLRESKNGKILPDGKRWVYNTYEEWQEYFPWMSLMSIRRVFHRLEEMGAIETCQPEGGISRRKYYRMLVGDTAVGGKNHAIKLNASEVQIDRFRKRSN